MTPVFADTSYFLALLNPTDALHGAATEVSRSLRQKVVTTDFVLAEVGNALSRANVRARFVGLVAHLREEPSVTLLPASRALFDLGYDLFGQRSDKDWSLTDCVSFEVMRQYGLTEALTADRHYKQAGFVVLMK